MTWQAIAAWVGTVLGVLNFFIAIVAKRPVFTVECRVIAGEAEAHLRITNIGERPLLVRRVCIRSVDGDIAPLDHADRFLKIVQPSESSLTPLVGLKRGSWCLVLIRWSQQRLAVPWSVLIIRSRLSRDIFDAMDPRP